MISEHFTIHVFSVDNQKTTLTYFKVIDNIACEGVHEDENKNEYSFRSSSYFNHNVRWIDADVQSYEGESQTRTRCSQVFL